MKKLFISQPMRDKTDEEIKGKAYVHWKSWHEAYVGIVSQEYLDKCFYFSNLPDDIYDYMQEQFLRAKS